MWATRDPFPERENLIAGAVRNHLASSPGLSAEKLQAFVLVSALSFNISKSLLEICSNGFKIKSRLLKLYAIRAVPVTIL